MDDEIQHEEYSATSEVKYDESKKGLSIASMVLGIVGIVISCTPIGLAASLLAIIFAGICINKKEGVKGFAIAGLVLGILSLAFWAFIFIINIALIPSSIITVDSIANIPQGY